MTIFRSGVRSSFQFNSFSPYLEEIDIVLSSDKDDWG
jgi:hypothetical protein